MNLREWMYRYKMNSVAHATLNPEGPGAVRIHLIPPKMGVKKNEANGIDKYPSVAILNGQYYVPVNRSYAILLNEFLVQLDKFAGNTITKLNIENVIRKTVNEVHKVYYKTNKQVLIDDLKNMVDVFVNIAYGNPIEEKIGYMSIGDYAPFMRAPHRMDLMISSMKKNGCWNCNQKCLHCYAAGQVEAELPESWNSNEEKSSSNEIIAMFLIDISGSMKTKSENKLIKVQEAISNSLQYIGPNSYVGMISYSTDVTVNVPISRFDEEQARKLNGEINGLTASGGTHMYEAIAVGMKLIEEEKEAHPNASVMMFVLSDGQPSSDAKGIDFVEEYVRILNIPIHTIGYGKDVDKVELKKLSDINEATFSYVEKEYVVETFKALFDSNF